LFDKVGPVHNTTPVAYTLRSLPLDILRNLGAIRLAMMRRMALVLPRMALG